MGNACGSCFGARAEGLEAAERLAGESEVWSHNEVEALFELFGTVSNSLVRDGLIHREEFRQALFGSPEPNLFADRLFELFDAKRNDVVDFSELVKGLEVFHPNAPKPDKTRFAFRLYDLKGTGFIEKDEVGDMLRALLRQNPDLVLTDDAVDEIIERTFKEVDLRGDGKIHEDEWIELVARKPACIGNMTLPVLRELTTRFPAFVMSSSMKSSRQLSIDKGSRGYALPGEA